MKRELALSVLVVGLLAGCGGKVVFVEDDGSGANGAGGAGPGPGPGPGPGQTNSSTSVGIETICQQWCNAYGPCVGGDCVSQCESFYTGVCDAELSNLLTCMTNTFNGDCNQATDACFAEEQAFSSCQGGTDCVTDFCEESPEGCYCSGICFGELKLEQQCFAFQPGGNGGEPGGPPPPPGIPCDCFLDGSYIGSCESPEFSCSVEEGCCQQLVGGIK